MSENSKIEWTDHTFNPWEGCQKVGPGCDHCYAETRNARFAGGTAINWEPGAPRRRTSAANWRKPLAWNAAHGEFYAAHGRRQRIFCASLADVFDNEVDTAWRIDLLDLIELTPNLNWLLLTKRIGNAIRMLKSHDWCMGRDNVWLGITVVNQAEADRDIPKLLATPARVRFLSVEPMLGPIDLERPMPGLDLDQGGGSSICQPWMIQSGIDWVIVGGESGHGARPMHPEWARGLREQCTAAGVPFLFKQWGEWTTQTPEQQKLLPGSVLLKHVSAWPDGTLGYGDFRTNGGYGKPLYPVGKRAAGRLLDGRIHDELPRDAS